MPPYADLILPGIRQIHAYTPGKPAEELEREIGVKGALKFASNENPHGPSPLALTAMREALSGTNRYGDAGCLYLRRELARLRGFSEEHFVALSGSSEGIYLSATLTCEPGHEIVFAHPPSFLLYGMAASLTGATPVRVPLRNLTHDLVAMRAAVTPRTRLVFICNPNNPTGTSNGQAEVDRFMDGLADHVLVVFDNAYAEYASRADYPDLGRYIRAGRAVAELRTFSKAYSLAGLRVAYVLAPPALAEFFNRARLPFNVDSVAQAAATAAVRDQDHVRRAVEVNRASLAMIREACESLGIEVTPTDANFHLVKLPMDARPVEKELERRGIIVRNMVAFGMPPQYLRITSGTVPQTEQLVRAFREVLSGAAAK